MLYLMSFQQILIEHPVTPAETHLFNVDEACIKVSNIDVIYFHHIGAKVLSLWKMGIPYI